MTTLLAVQGDTRVLPIRLLAGFGIRIQLGRELAGLAKALRNGLSVRLVIPIPSLQDRVGTGVEQLGCFQRFQMPVAEDHIPTSAVPPLDPAHTRSRVKTEAGGVRWSGEAQLEANGCHIAGKEFVPDVRQKSSKHGRIINVGVSDGHKVGRGNYLRFPDWTNISRHYG
jgi:hypothetical protein